MTRDQVLEIILATARRRGWDAGRNGKPRTGLDGAALCGIMAREAGQRVRAAEAIAHGPRVARAYGDGFSAGERERLAATRR